MQRRIRDVFEYKDYRILLNDDFIGRSTGNHNYSLRAYARDLKISSSFVSDVFRGKRDLSPQKGREVFAKIGFQLEELDYIENLINLKTTKDPMQKQMSAEAIGRKYKKPEFFDDEEKDLILKSADHFIVHGIVGGESDFKKLCALCAKAGVNEERVAEVVAEFVEKGFFRQDNDQYFIEYKNLKVPNHEKILSTQRAFVNRLITLTENNGGMKMPEQMGHYLVFALDKETAPLFEQTYHHLINSISRLSNQTPVAERYCFFSSSFFSIPVKTQE